MQRSVLNKQGKFGVKLLWCYTDMAIFVLRCFILTHPVHGLQDQVLGWLRAECDYIRSNLQGIYSQAQRVRSSLFSVNHAVYLFSTRKKSCVLSEQVPFVLKLDDVIVTSPS